MPNPEHIIQPIDRDPDGLVENIYREPGTVDLPDLESQDRMGEYLIERFEPDPGPRIRVVMTETGKTLPRVESHVVGWRDTAYYERDGWYITPRVAAAVMVGSAILSVAKPALLDIGDEAKEAGHVGYRIIKPVHDTKIDVPHTSTELGPVRHVNVNAEAGNTSGSAAIDQVSIERFKQQIAKVVTSGGKLKSVTITGRSSDDYGTNASIGRPETADQDFADDRARAYASAMTDVVSPYQKGTNEISIVTKVDQSVLGPAQKNLLAETAVASGFNGPNNIIDAMNAVSHDQVAPGRLKQLVNKLFIAKRGVTLDAAIALPGQEQEVTTYTHVVIPGEDNPPADPKRDYDPWFIPLIPIPRFRRMVKGLRPIKRLRLVPGKSIFMPSILREEDEQAWLRLRPEAVEKDGTLVENSWAYTRKYEHLLRDGRIVDLLRADYKDAEGKLRSLRVMFVDTAPAQEALDAFEALLTKFAAMEGGKLGERVSGIFVYQSENTGTTHGDPKRIAMGIDKQSHEGILGTYTYALDLVELHMPTTWDADELQEMFNSFYGPGWTVAHEVGGHGTDDSDQPLHLRRVLALGIPQAHVITGDPRARKMRPLQAILRRLPESIRQKTSPMQFDIQYPVVDNNGQIVTQQARVHENDPRLAHATHSTIVGYKPTRYAGTNVSEDYAEVAAGTITGIPVPYDEAHVTVPGLTTDEGQQAVFAEGYHPDARAQALFTKSVGAEQGSLPVTFANPPEVTISHINPANDALIRQEMQRARSSKVLDPAQMVAILARVTQRNRSKKA